MKQYARLLSYLTPYRGRLAVVLVLSLLSTLTGLVSPYFSKILVDEVLLGRNPRLLLIVTLALFGVMILTYVLNGLSSVLYVGVSARVLLDMRLDLYQHVQSLSLKFYHNTRLGEILSRLNNDIAEAQRVVSDTLLALVTNALFLAGAIVLLIILNWKLFLLGAALLPLGFKGMVSYRRRVHHEAKTIRESSAAIGSFLVESLSAIRLVKAFGSEQWEAEKFRAKNEHFIRSLVQFQRLSLITAGLPALMMALSTFAVLLYGGYLVIGGGMTIGSLVAFAAYQMRLVPPVQNLTRLYMNVQRARASLERVFEFLDLTPDVRERPDVSELPRVAGRVDFDRVTMSYESGQPVLKNVSFSVPAGSRCAIVGPSGVGKSTIADLLLRFYDPQGGMIHVDDHDLKDVTLESLRRQICLVDQETFLFNATIEENLRYARPHATQEEIEDAAAAAALHEFIEGLPHGYQTICGERGVKFSAGQRQRLAIARAILRDPAILILDEATSALDWAAESSVKEAMVRTMHGRTTIIISHRLSLVQDADCVVVLDGGEVVQAGSHDQLLNREGPYRRLFFSEKAASHEWRLDHPVS